MASRKPLSGCAGPTVQNFLNLSGGDLSLKVHKLKVLKMVGESF